MIVDMPDIPKFLDVRSTKRGAATLEAVSVDVPAAEPLITKMEELANAPAREAMARRAKMQLELLRHLGVEVTKHRDGTFSGRFNNCHIMSETLRGFSRERKGLLDLVQLCWEFDSRSADYGESVDYDEAKRAVEFEAWLNEQMEEMGAARAKQIAQQVPRPLDDLAGLIREQLRLSQEAAERAAAPHWFEVGKLLHEAKAQLDHGEFGDWCKRHFKIGPTQRARYMKAAESAVQNFRAGKYEAASLEDHLQGTSYQTGGKTGAAPHPAYAAHSAALDHDQLKRAEEHDLRRKLVLKLIDRGYKSLASELHPDKGGSTDAMTRLNEVRNAMKRCTTGIGVF
jgi:hypothetical protein